MSKKKHLTPLKAVRKYCLWCCYDSPKEVRLCPSSECPLWPLRFGANPEKISVLKAIKARCLDCGEGTAQAVRKCDLLDCRLHPYRNGKNPARKGIGNISNINRGKAKK